MAGNGRVNKVVFSADLADGAGLKQFVPGKAGAPGMAHGGQQAARFGAQGEHIILQRHDHRGFLRLDRLLFGARSVAGIQVDGAVLVPEHAGVKGDGIPRALPQDATLPVPHHAVEHIVPGGGIAYRHADGLHLVVGAVVEVVAPILALYHVGGPQFVFPVGHAGVLGAVVDNPLVPPVRQVGDRGRPADIIVFAELSAVKAVMAAIEIQPVPEHMGLPVGNVFIQRQIGVHRLPFALLFHLQASFRG